MALWQLSIDTARLMSRYVPCLAESTIPTDAARGFIEEFKSLGKRWNEALEPMYTPFALESDNYARAGLHIAHLLQYV